MKGNYVGANITRDDSWLLELAHIPDDIRHVEPALHQSRWFDYRHLLPAQATYRFAAEYDAAYRESYAQLRDYRDAEKARTLNNEDIFKGPDLLPMWRARQEADGIGCRYDFYLRFIFKRCWERRWPYLPRPNQLYGEEITLDAADAWKELCSASLQLAQSKRFLLLSYEGHPDQDSYHSYLVEQVRARVHPHLTLARLIYRENMLPAEVAERYFGKDAVQAAFIHFHS